MLHAHVVVTSGCTSQLVEQGWGMLLNRFRIWKASVEYRTADFAVRISKEISSCMLIHNLAINNSDWASGTIFILVHIWIDLV
jgi:hypothetical protein